MAWRLTLGCLVLVASAAFALAGYSYRPVPQQHTGVDLLTAAMVAAGASIAYLDTDGVYILKDADGQVVGRLELVGP